MNTTIIGLSTDCGFDAKNRGYLVECSCGEMAVLSENYLTNRSSSDVISKSICFECSIRLKRKNFWVNLGHKIYSSKGSSILQKLGYDCE